MSKITAFFKRPSTSTTHATDNDNISPENAEPPNKKALKSGSRENTAYLKTVLHWKKDLTIDLGYKLSKLEGQSEVVEEIWCETCRNFSSDRSSSTRSEETVELQHIMEEIGKMFRGRRRGSEWSVPWPYNGLICAARFTEDKIWYRALVTGVNSDETVNVTYVDFGNSEKLPFSDIRKLPDMFLRLPKQAVRICLVDIKPNEDKSEWEKEDQDNVANLLLNRSVVVDVKGVTDDKMSVLLYDTSGSRDVCINEFLVLNGYCQSAGLGYVKEKKELKEQIETGKLKRKRSMHRALACSFKNSCSIVKSRDELVAERDKGEQSQQEQQQESDSQQSSVTGSEVQGDQLSQCSSVTEDEKAVTEDEKAVMEEKVVLQEGSVTAASSDARVEFQYRPASVPESNRFPAGITFVDSQGYIYAQEVKEGDRTLINIMGSLLERYGKGDDTTATPSDTASVAPGLPCCAQFSEDGMWYRAKVVKVLDQDKVEVNYIDFGNSEVVPPSALRQEIPFIEVPQQCLQLVLRGIEPKTGDGHWPAETIQVLSQMIVGQDCVAAIKGEKLPGYPLVVTLCLPDGSDVAHTLLSRGLVKKSALSEAEESPQFYPRKVKGPGKSKRVKSITEMRAHAQKISSREAECMLAHTELPEEGIRFDVTITHIERPDCLFIQRVPPTDDDAGFSDDPDPTLERAIVELQSLEKIMARINEPDFFQNYTPLTTAAEGMLCCARYSEDEMWYRAQVKSVTQEKPLEVRVVYVDYGTTEVVTGDRLRGFPSELLELPIQSIRCFLADVRQPDTTEGPMMDDGCWPVSTMEVLIQLVAGKKLVAQTLFTGPPASVILYEHRQETDGSVEEVSIGYLLAQRGLAKYTDYENVKHEESNDHEQGSCASDEAVLDSHQSELSLTSEAAATGAESKTSFSSDLLEKLLAPQLNAGATPASKPKLLTPSVLSSKNYNESSTNCNSETEDTMLSSSIENDVKTGDESRDQKQVSSQPVTSASGSQVPKVNQDSVESSV